MELKYFLSVLSKRKWLLLTVMLASAAATFFVVGKLPKKYRSAASIATGITVRENVRVDQSNEFVQEFIIDNRFANFIEEMKARPAINSITKKLVLHDLRPQEGKMPFRELKKDKSNLSELQIKNYLDALETRADSLGISESDLENLHTGRTLEKALGYDYESLRDDIIMKRAGKTDYVAIEFISEKPDLTFFVTKNFVDECLAHYYDRADTTKDKSLAFYNNRVSETKRVLDSLNNRQVAYAKANGLVAPMEQAVTIVNQIKDLEIARDEQMKSKASYSETAKYLDGYEQRYRRTLERDYSVGASNNDDLIGIDMELSKLTNKWVDGNMKDEVLGRRIEELKVKKRALSQRDALARRDDRDPAKVRNQELFLKHVEAETGLKATTQAVDAYDRRITELYGQKTQLVKDNAEWLKMSREIEDAAAKYKDAFEKQNEADVIKRVGEKESPVRIIEPAMYPYQPEPAKKMLLSAFSSVGIGTLATLLLFGLSYFDKSVGSLFQFRKQIRLPLLGALNKLDVKRWSDFDGFFKSPVTGKDVDFFKESLRKIRHDIKASDSKSFLFVSLRDQEGKSMLAASLAYILSLKNKKVLIIDTNFKNNTLTALSVKPMVDNHVGYDAQTLQNTTRLSFNINMPTVDIIGNQGGHNSPSELLAGVDFRKKIEELGERYDYIFLEAAAINKYSDARELVDFVDKVIPVFDASKTLTSADESGLQFLRSLGTKVLGGVLNKADLKNLN